MLGLLLLGEGFCQSSDTASEPDRTFQEGLKRYRASDLAAAEKNWTSIFPDKLYGPAAYVLLAQGHHQRQNHRKTESVLREFLKQYPDSVYQDMGRRMLAAALCGLKSSEAVPMLTSMIERSSEQDKPSLTLLLARIEKQLGNHSKAAEHYRKLLLEYPATVEGLKASEEIAWMVVHGKIPVQAYSEREQMGRAQRLFRSGRFDLAADLYRGLLKDKPSNPEVELKLATCLFKDRKDREAARILKELLNRKISDEDRIEALHLLSRIYWRTEQNDDFVRCCEEIIQKGSRRQKDKALFNLGAHHYELGKLQEAHSYFTRVLNSTSNASMKTDIQWKIAWIQYRTGKYAEAAEAFRQARVSSPGGGIADASRYWQARCLIRLNRSTEAKALLKDTVRRSPLEYYGQEAERLLASMGSPTSPGARTEHFPDVTLTEAHLANEQVAAANKLIELDLGDLALMHLDALPGSLKSSPAIAFLTARAAHGAKQYKRARDILSASFRAFMEDPSDGSPPQFVELAFPRVHRKAASAAAKQYGVDPHLVWAVVRQESVYEPSAVSPAGALGLMQVTPAAAGVVGKHGSIAAKAIEKLLDPEQNLVLGIKILSKNLASFNGKIVPALAAYNADIRKVRSWVRRNGKMEEDEFIENIPFLETRLYVKKVLGGYRAYSMLHRKSDLAGLW